MEIGKSQLQDNEIEHIVLASLTDYLPDAARITREHFCNGCPRQKPGCFPCAKARTVFNIYLPQIVAIRARNN